MAIAIVLICLEIYHAWRSPIRLKTYYLAYYKLTCGRWDKSPRKSSSTLEEANTDNKVSESAKTNDEVLETSANCPRKIKTPSKRRKHGYGGGYIECKPIKRGGKEYKQYWYHYEFWREGERLTKKSRYIPKRLVPKVEKMNNEKAPVEKILKVLQNRVKSQTR